jgi:hypothetical protein
MDMGQEQERPDLNSPPKLLAKGLVQVVLLQLYFKLVVVDKGTRALWKMGFSLFLTSTCITCKHVDLSAFEVYPEDEQVRPKR